jgi:hypothetical protein
VNGRVLLFSVIAPLAYTIANYFNLSLFRYYPSAGRFSFAGQPDLGSPILLYGWITTAILSSALAAFIVPRRWSDRLPPDLCWMALSVALFAALIYEKRWFF